MSSLYWLSQTMLRCKIYTCSRMAVHYWSVVYLYSYIFSFLFLSVPACSCLFLSLTACSCLLLSFTVSSCLYRTIQKNIDIYSSATYFADAAACLAFSAFCAQNKLRFLRIKREKYPPSLSLYVGGFLFLAEKGTSGGGQRVLNDCSRTRLSSGRMIRLHANPHPPLSREQVVSLSQSSCVSPVELTDERGGG